MQIIDYAVYTTNGAMLCSSESSPKADLLARFPNIAAGVLYSNVVAGSMDWWAKEDLSRCVVVRRGGGVSADVEMWHLKPAAKLDWVWKYEEKNGPLLCSVQLLVLNGQDLAAVNCGRTIVFLNAENGKRVDEVPLGSSGDSFCIVPGRAWLVYGGLGSKRVRVVDLMPPHRVIRDAGREGTSRFGTWSTDRIQVAAAGRFLLKECTFSSRLLGFTRETEVLTTDTWNVIWNNEDHGRGIVAISPNGNRIAVLRGKVLELRPFEAIR